MNYTEFELFDHIFINESICKYCGYALDGDIYDILYNYVILPKCISDEEKIIKDIIE